MRKARLCRLGVLGQTRALVRRRAAVCWRWDWRRAHTDPTAPAAPSPATARAIFFFRLHEAGFAYNRCHLARRRHEAHQLWISAVVAALRRPTSPRRRSSATAPLARRGDGLLRDLRVVVCLGRIAFDGLLERTEMGTSRRSPRLHVCPWSRIHASERPHRHRQLSSIVAEH